MQKSTPIFLLRLWTLQIWISLKKCLFRRTQIANTHVPSPKFVVLQNLTYNSGFDVPY